jgi:hypothetical protein
MIQHNGQHMRRSDRVYDRRGGIGNDPSPVDHDRAHGLTVQMKMMAPTLPDGAEMDRVFYNYR